MLRVERKYLVPYESMDALRERFSSFVRNDRYALKNEDGISQYTVRSIYFDSRNMACYSDKHEGVMLRRKLRIRGYENGESEQVVLEIKRKIASRQKKYRSLVRFSDVEKMLETGNLEKYIILNGSGSLTDASKFMYHIKKGNYIPTCLITYEREAFHGKFDHGVRITFDKNIRSRLYPEIESLYSERNMKLLFKKHFILEIKYFSQQMPLWVRSVVQEFRLRNDALSKYAIGIDVNREKVVATY
jgi:SPX domain protein involved in polyphosphate accumulation